MPDAVSIDGEIIERGLAVVPTEGVAAIAAMSDAEFDRSLAMIAKGQSRILRMQEALLVKGIDYANVPGVDKPSLGKPGAEKLCAAYHLAARIETALHVGDGVTTPPLRYEAKCYLHASSLDGPVVGTGSGNCSSWEAKYRYRKADRVCPKCGLPTIIKGREEYGGGWLCFAKKGGCGAKFADNAPAIVEQVTGQMDNPDPWDLANTIEKMAAKRAHTDATLRTLAASGIFTQDMEENVPAEAEPKPEPAKVKSQPEAAAAVAEKRAARVSANTPPPLDDADLDSLVASAAPAHDEPQAAPAPEPGIGLSELQKLAAAQIVGLSELNAEARKMFDSRTINLLTNAERGRLWSVMRPA